MPVKFDLGEYLNDVLVETGTGTAGNVLAAVRAGFPEIHSIELSPALYAAAHRALEAALAGAPRRSNVVLYQGHSVAGLRQVCGQVHHRRATFILDAYSAPGDATEAVAAERPLLEEIGVIAQRFRDSLILPVIIVCGIGRDVGGPPLDAVVDAVLDLCADYQFRVRDDDRRRNVLVALPPTWTQAC